MKRCVSLLLCVSLAFALAAPASAAGLSGFQKVNSYEPGQFSDVKPGVWYTQNVKTAYEYGLMTGKRGGKFDPGGNMTIVEAIVVACRLRSAYYGDNAVFARADPWYQPYVDYAKKNGIIEQDYPYTAQASRLDFALFISNALPDAALREINHIAQNDIPDLYAGSPYEDALTALTGAGVISPGDLYQLQIDLTLMAAGVGAVQATKAQDAVYRLYRAGILTGGDRYGTFAPSDSITRGSVATIVSRVADPSLRKSFTLAQKQVELVPAGKLANLPSVKGRATAAQFAQAYDAAKPVVEPLRGLSREAQLCGIAMAVRVITERDVAYSMQSAHYADPYGFFVDHSASCAGCTRATGLCLNMLGIPYEHVNENAYSHQWARVELDGVYWICDAYGLYCGPEQAPRLHPYLS